MIGESGRQNGYIPKNGFVPDEFETSERMAQIMPAHFSNGHKLSLAHCFSASSRTLAKLFKLDSALWHKWRRF